MHFSDDLKLLGLALPFAGMAWKWLRSHNDRTVGPPPPVPDDKHIADLVRSDKKLEAIRAIRRKYKCSLQQAVGYYESMRAARKSG